MKGFASRLAFATTFLLLAGVSVTEAQIAEINLPGRADTESANGVSFKTGAFNTSGIVDLSIGGEGNAGLQLVRSYSSTHAPNYSASGGQGWSHNRMAAIYRNPQVSPPDVEPPPAHLVRLDYTVLTGTGTSRFQGGSATSWAHRVGAYDPHANNGETLVFTKIGDGGISSGSYFTFIDAQGAEYIYPAKSAISLESVTYPDGTKLTRSANSKVTISNRGYALLWESSTKACVINMAEHYVTSATTTCPAGVQTVTYAYGTGSYETGGGNIATATNALGQTTTYIYGGFNHLTCIKDPGQSACRISNTYSVCLPPAYNQPANRLLDQVISQTTGTGETYTYSYTYPQDLCNQYTGYGVDSSMVAPGNATTNVATNAAGAIGWISDPLGRQNSYGYETGLWNEYDGTVLASVSQPEGNGQWVSRDGRGNVFQKDAGAKPGSGYANITTTANYIATCTNRKTCNKPNYIIDARGNRTDYTWDPNHGGMLTETKPAGPNGIRPQKRYNYTQQYAWIKNSSGGFVQAATPVWLVSSTSECMTLASCAGTADEIKTTYTYGSTGTANNLLPTVVTISAGDNSISATTTTTYDFAGNPITEDGPLAGTADTTRIRYDAMRRVIGTIKPDPDGAGALVHSATRNTFDPSGELIKSERGTVNSQSDADWAAFNSLESVDMTYDLMGRKLKETKSAGGTTYAVTQHNYDGSGRLLCTAIRMDPSQWITQTDACLPQTLGPHGPDRISKYVYNLAGERTILKKGFGTTDEADEETSTYTANGKLWTITDGEGNRTTYTYDGHDRLQKTNFPHPSTDGVSSSTDYEQFTYDANGNTTQRRLRDSQVINFSFDNLNRMSLKDLPAPEVDVSYSSYDLQGRLKQVSNTHTLTYTWDVLGRLRTEGSFLGNMSYEYDLAGRRIRTQWPDGFYVTHDFYVTGETSAIREYGAGSGVGVLATYTYDNRGNRIGITRGNGTTTTISPDAVSRLSAISHNLGGTAQDVTSTFGYNPANQIATNTRDNDSYAWGGHFNVNRTYVVNGLNQATNDGSSSIGYDARGNLASRGSTTYAYTAENRLTTVPGVATLLYDAAGRMFVSSINSTYLRLQYDGTDLTAEYDSGNVMQRRYVHGPGADEPLVWYEGSGTADRRWFHQDERGSVIALSNSSGNSIATNTYDEYGNPGAANLGRFSYTGQTWLSGLGLHYYKARMYSPSLGRFMQTDPIGYGDGINWYNYVGSDPLNSVDPDGELAFLVPLAIFAYKAYSAYDTVKSTVENTKTITSDTASTGDKVMAVVDIASNLIGGKAGDKLADGVRAITGKKSPLDVKEQAAKLGAKSATQMAEHLEKLGAARNKVAELTRQLEKAKGPKAQNPIREEIQDLKDQIKGHEKEIRQKWPELGDDF